MTHTARFVPTVVLGFLTKVGDLSTPLSLIYIGALAGGSGIVQLFKEKMALEISVVKMIGMPALAILAMLFIPADGLAKSVFLLSVCMPSAAVVPMMVGRYGYGDKMSSDIVLLDNGSFYGNAAVKRAACCKALRSSLKSLEKTFIFG